MTTPEPENSPTPPPQKTLESLIDAFKGLPPLLSYSGLILVVAFIFLYFTGVLPDILLAVPLIAIVAFLIYAYMERRFDLQTTQSEQEYELKKRAQELEHAIAMEGRKPEEPPQKPQPGDPHQNDASST